jgi:hypothetical protein
MYNFTTSCTIIGFLTPWNHLNLVSFSCSQICFFSSVLVLLCNLEKSFIRFVFISLCEAYLFGDFLLICLHCKLMQLLFILFCFCFLFDLFYSRISLQYCFYKLDELAYNSYNNVSIKFLFSRPDMFCCSMFMNVGDYLFYCLTTFELIQFKVYEVLMSI